MADLDQLKQDACEAARCRDHELDAWADSKYGAQAECKHCDAYVQVLVKPMPNEIDIGGTAVALNCPHFEDGPESKQHRR